MNFKIFFAISQRNSRQLASAPHFNPEGTGLAGLALHSSHRILAYFMIMNANLITLASGFQIEGRPTAVTPIGSGHIHDSYLVSTLPSEAPDLFLQCINHKIFTNIGDLTGNILKVTSHLQNKLNSNSRLPFHPIRLIPTTSGEWWHQDDAGTYWRMFNYITGCRSYDRLGSPTRAYQAGFAFGNFQALTADMDSRSLVEILPDFHHIGKRLRKFRETVAHDRVGRTGLAEHEIRFVESRAEEMHRVIHLAASGQIPVRVTHNDTKCNNVLFDVDDRAIAVIDLDTVMPGTILYDFGDAIRTGASTADEDEADTSRIGIDLRLFQAYSEGYLHAAKEFLIPEEIATLAFSARLMTYTIGLRFLTDYIDGDRYYKISAPDHNLLRARAQFKLLTSMEKQAAEMDDVIRKAAG